MLFEVLITCMKLPKSSAFLGSNTLIIFFNFFPCLLAISSKFLLSLYVFDSLTFLNIVYSDFQVCLHAVILFSFLVDNVIFCAFFF